MSSHKKKIRIKKKSLPKKDKPISDFFSTDAKITYVYTDGSTFHNVRGSSKARGGYGVFWGENDKRNIGDDFDIFPITNNRCELYAVIKAVKIFIKTKPKEGEHILRIMTDSMLIVNSMNKWIKNWIKRSWKKSNGKMVENVDLLHCLNQLIEDNRDLFRVEFHHVKAAHDYNEPKDKNTTAWKIWNGNTNADRLARIGTSKSFKKAKTPKKKLCSNG